MAGDVHHEPFSLSFQVDSFHSGSISFGRFERESLSWERRSSFSHNRYLEEVEKYARPGSVMEKAAFLEAHFRRKNIQHQASSESQVQEVGSVNENGSCEKDTFGENSSGNRSDIEQVDHHNNENSGIGHINKTPRSSCHGRESKDTEEVRETCDASLDTCSESAGSVVQQNISNDFREEFQEEISVKIHSNSQNVVTSCDSEQASKTVYEHDHSIMSNVQHNINVKSKSNCDTQDVQEDECRSRYKVTTESGMDIGPTTAPKLIAVDKNKSSGIRSRSQGHIPVSRKTEVKKGGSQNIHLKERLVPTRTRTGKEKSKSIGSPSQSTVRNLRKENQPGLKVKVPEENRSEKDLRSKRTVSLQPSTPERTESRGRLSTARTKQVTPINKEIKRSTMNSSLRVGEGGDKKKEEKNTDTRQFGGSLNSKPKAMASLNYDAASRGSSGLKARVNPYNSRSSRLPSKSLNIGDQRAAGRKVSLGTGNNGAVSPTKSVCSSASFGRRYHDINKNTKGRYQVRKEEVQREKRTPGKKQGLAEFRQAEKGRSIKAPQKVDMGRSGNAITRKVNIVHASSVSHHTVGVAS